MPSIIWANRSHVFCAASAAALEGCGTGLLVVLEAGRGAGVVSGGSIGTSDWSTT
jgi:hypothetical protein